MQNFYQAIVTRYHGPTNTKGARISAKASAGGAQVHWDHGKSVAENHRIAAQKLIDRLGWVAPRYGEFVGGVLPSGDHVFVMQEKAV